MNLGTIRVGGHLSLDCPSAWVTPDTPFGRSTNPSPGDHFEANIKITTCIGTNHNHWSGWWGCALHDDVTAEVWVLTGVLSVRLRIHMRRSRIRIHLGFRIRIHLGLHLCCPWSWSGPWHRIHWNSIPFNLIWYDDTSVTPQRLNNVANNWTNPNITSKQKK